MKTKLILVEGLPGFGKSTTAKLIKNILDENDIESELYLEGNLDHPADYDGVAWLSEDEWHKVRDSFKDVKNALDEFSTKKENSYFISHQKMRNKLGSAVPSELYDQLVTKDIYELPLETHIQLIVNKWKDFCNKARNSEMTYIFECCFIQNPVTIGLIKYAASDKVISRYVKDLETAISELHPTLIYVDQKDIEYTFKKALNERPKEWSEFFISYYTTQGFGLKHHLSGIEGTVKVLQARRDLENKIYEQLKINKIKMDNSSYEIDPYKVKLSNAIKM